MNLEIEKGSSLKDISQILSSMGASVEISECSVVGNFELSNCRFVFWYCEGSGSVTAERANLSWCVGVEGAFHCRANVLSESWTDIKSFLVHLSKKTVFRFVLSFQYEVYMRFVMAGMLNLLSRWLAKGLSRLNFWWS